MNIIYTDSLPDKDDFFNLFKTTGWNQNYGLTKDELYQAVMNSWYYISAYDNENLVGFGRVISDGIVHALILDMIIRPEYQGNGIGKEILDKIVTRCRSFEIRDIQLFSAKGKAGFYEKYGFSRRSYEWPGMEIKIKKGLP